MNPDISRRSFQEEDPYAQVLFQQGRPLVDADLNEQADILAHQTRALARAVFGECCAIDPEAFRISQRGPLNTPVGEAGINFSIGKGRMYAHGILCDNTRIEQYGDQFQYGKTVARDVQAGWWLVFLELWEQTVTAAIDSRLLEPAFGGADTAARSKLMFRVRILGTQPIKPLTGPGLDSPKDAFDELKKVLHDARDEQGKATFAVSPSAETFENLLYRVEIHRIQGGATAATVKFSRSNASVTFAVKEVKRLGDNLLSFAVDPNLFQDPSFPQTGSWIEVSTRYDLEKRSVGRLGRLTKIAAEGTCELETSALLDIPDDGNAFMRPWDQVIEALPFDKGPVAIDDGLEMTLHTNNHRPGDFWLVSIRDRTAAPVAREPDGPKYHWVPLGGLELAGEGKKQVIKTIKPVLPVYNLGAMLKWPTP